MRVVVVGASGNIGTSLLRRLAGVDGTDVVGVARRLPDSAARSELGTQEWRRADIATDDLSPVVAGADAVVHLAWLVQPSRDRSLLWRVNALGSKRLFRAAAEAGAGTILYSSSVGAYSPGPREGLVDETWPTDGIAPSYYSRQKADVEHYLDAFERDHPSLRIVRFRPALIFKRESATHVRRLFAGPFVPGSLLRPGLLPAVPAVTGMRFQCVHVDDVADAFARALETDASGAFNLAAEPVLEPEVPAELLEAPAVPVPASVARAAASTAYHARLTSISPDWLDMGLAVPMLATDRARNELGWQPQHGARETLAELLAGLRDASGGPTAPLAPETSGLLRWRELATRLGSRP